MKILFTIFKTLIILAVVAIILASVALFTAIGMVFDDRASLSEFDKASLEDIKRIKKIALQVSNQIQRQGVQEITLSERDINLAISHFGPATIAIPDDTFAKVALSSQANTVQATVPVNYVSQEIYQQLQTELTSNQRMLFNALRSLVADKWINASWRVNIDANAPEGQWLSPGKLSIGSLTLNENISAQIADTVLAEVLKQPNSRQITAAWKNIKGIAQNDQQVTVNYILPANGQNSLESYQSLILSQDEQQLVAIYSAMINALPKRGPLVRLLAPMFEEAAKRSSRSSDPVAENRAVILALAKAFGGDEINAMLNADTRTNTNFERASPPYTIYGRRDLAQHMVLSAGLTLVADEGIAELVGLDKEISDLMEGKTISAWDLLADKAGVRFAQNATRSARSARDLQLKIAKVKRDSEILPDLGADFSYAEDRFSTEDLDEITMLVDLYLEELDILRK